MSKGLEALKGIFSEFKLAWRCNGDFLSDSYQEELLKPVVDDLKALDIIIKKNVNVFIFLHSGDLETYNDMVEDNRKLTQEEYDLLKEVLL